MLLKLSFKLATTTKIHKTEQSSLWQKNQDGCFKGNIKDEINVFKNLQNVYFFIQQLSNKRDYKNGYFEL